MPATDNLRQPQWIIKIGSSIIADPGKGLRLPAIRSIASQIHTLVESGVHVLLVSSGAVALGMQRASKQQRPQALDLLQALAALGQADLVACWRQELNQHGLDAALVLLTRWDTEDRSRYLNIRNTFAQLRQLGIIAIVNENDSVAVDELQFGDNDILAGLVANITDADKLILLTDQNGLYTGNPSTNPDAQLINQAQLNDHRLASYATESTGKLGRGGMKSKLEAAHMAARSGCDTWILNGNASDCLIELAKGHNTGTWLSTEQPASGARQTWLANRSHAKGALYMDAGATRAILEEGASLLAVGIKRIEGAFNTGDLVHCFDPDSKLVAVGLINFNHHECSMIIGKHSTEITSILNKVVAGELIHRDNLALFPTHRN
ncbi:MAG: glutamate 5-kinase [Gammaproteobacteria bacterium]